MSLRLASSLLASLLSPAAPEPSQPNVSTRFKFRALAAVNANECHNSASNLSHHRVVERFVPNLTIAKSRAEMLHPKKEI